MSSIPLLDLIVALKSVVRSFLEIIAKPSYVEALCLESRKDFIVHFISIEEAFKEVKRILVHVASNFTVPTACGT